MPVAVGYFVPLGCAFAGGLIVGLTFGTEYAPLSVLSAALVLPAALVQIFLLPD